MSLQDSHGSTQGKEIEPGEKKRACGVPQALKETNPTAYKLWPAVVKVQVTLLPTSSRS